MKRGFLVASLVALVWVFSPSSAEAANRWVCAAGDATCGGTPAHTTLANALTAASCGDVIFLKVGETHTASTTLPDKSCTATLNTNTGAVTGTPITIRSAGSDTNFPAWGQRMTSAYSSVLAVIKSGSSDPAIKTAAGASGYVLKFLKFEANSSGFNTLISIGTNDTTQQFLADQPEEFILDRIWMTGDSLVGQKRGLETNGKNISVVNSTIEAMAAVGGDSQAIALFNGTGPILIQNNFLEGAGYGFILGGAVPTMHSCATVKASPAPTTTVFTLENFKGTVDNDCDGQATAASVPDHSIASLAVGQNVAIQTGANLREWAKVTAIAGNQITIDTNEDTGGNQPLSIAPATGFDVRWGYQPNDVTFRRNFVYKRPTWKSPILGTPGNVQAAESLTGGTLVAGSYCYRVVAFAVGQENQSINSAPATEKCATLTATGSVVVSWTAVTNAATYRVYGRSSGGQNQYFTVMAPTVTYTDTGSSGTNGTTPTSGTFWQVKNSFEWKFGDRGIVEDNIFDGSWQGTDDGPGIWLKGATNQSINGSTGGRGEFVTGDDFTFRYNVVRRVPGCFSLVGNEAEPYSSALDRPKPGDDWLIEHNLCYDSGAQHNFPANKTNQSAFTIANGFSDIAIRKNTIIHNQQKAVYCLGRVLTGTNAITDNLFAHGSYGVMQDGGGSGVAAWTACGGTTFTNNTMAGGTSGSYPNNLTPSLATWQAAFVNYGGTAITDYALVSGHTYRTAGTAGGMIGADIATLNTHVAGVVEGVSATSPIFTTTTIPNGTQNVAYSVQIVTTSGTGAHTFTQASGTLPTGITLSAKGILSGTTTQTGSFTFTVRATDTLGVSADQPYSFSIAAAVAPVTITTTTLPTANTATVYNQTLSASGGGGNYSWSVSTGSLPPGITLGASTGVLLGRPTLTGSFAFTVLVSSGALTDPQDYTLTVTPSGVSGPATPLDPSPRPVSWNGQEIFTFSRNDCTALVASDRPRVRDICIDTTNKIFIVTATSPAITLKPISGPRIHITFHAAENLGGEAVAMGGSEISTQSRLQQRVDMTAGYTECRMTASIINITIAGAKLAIQWSSDGSVWDELGASDAQVSVASDTTGLKFTDWVTLDPAVQAEDDARLRAFWTDGNGSTSAIAAGISLECR